MLEKHLDAPLQTFPPERNKQWTTRLVSGKVNKFGGIRQDADNCGEFIKTERSCTSVNTCALISDRQLYITVDAVTFFMPRIYKSAKIIWLVLVFFCCCTSQVNAVEPGHGTATIKELTATTTEENLIVFGVLENSFTSEMVEILRSGIPLHFSFFIELYRTTENWPEEQIATLSFQHVMAYDTLKENYRVTLEEDNNKIVSFKSLFDAQKMMNEINGVTIVQLNQLIPENRYKLKVRADIFKKIMPFNLNKLLPFVSWGDIKTEWHTIEFEY